MLIIILYFFIVVVAIQLLLFRCFRKICSPNPKKTTAKTLSISVIVCAKMKKKINFIPMLAEQNYPNFEIVLIDDASSDSTLDILRNLKTISNIRLVKVRNNEAFWGNKKYALTLGIKAAKKRIFIIY
jgi:glycosyltransferase involved in cell wall biosynthesis